VCVCVCECVSAMDVVCLGSRRAVLLCGGECCLYMCECVCVCVSAMDVVRLGGGRAVLLWGVSAVCTCA